MDHSRVKRWEVLAGLIREHGYTSGAELGVWEGATLSHILRTQRRLQMFAVDRWQPVGTYAGKDMAAAKAKTLRAIAPYRNRVEILEMDTVRAAWGIPDASLDFIFIDASHDYESVRADIKAWEPKVRAGGMLCGHDANWSGVKRALDELLPGWRLLLANVWMRKKQ